jgi:tetratricopeptide (TPR) repeat protein
MWFFSWKCRSPPWSAGAIYILPVAPAAIGTVLVAGAKLLSAMRFRLLPVLAGLLLLALLSSPASANGGADSRLDEVTDLMRVGLMDDALADLTAVQAEYPASLRAWMIRGLILGYVGRADGGRSEADARLAVDPADAQGLALAVGVAVADGDAVTARSASERLVVAAPESPDAWDIRGGVLSLEGTDEAVAGARTAFDRALALDATHVDALINRGELVEPTDPDEAERYLRRAVEARPASTDANEAWTTFLVGQERTAEALGAYDAWLAESPANAIALMGKATVLANAGRFEEALWLVENVVRDDPGYRDGLYLQGQLLLALDRPADAVEAMNALLAQYPGDDDAEALRSEAAARVQAGAGAGNTTVATTAPVTQSPVPAGAALAAVALLALARRGHR